MTGYTIYHAPQTHPHHYVVRRWRIMLGEVVRDPAPWAVVGSLEVARDSLPRGLHPYGRTPSDSLEIVESWM